MKQTVEAIGDGNRFVRSESPRRRLTSRASIAATMRNGPSALAEDE